MLAQLLREELNLQNSKKANNIKYFYMVANGKKRKLEFCDLSKRRMS
jgi:hypothetical protein